MQALLQYLFKQYISQETSTIIKRLYKLQPLPLNTSLQILPADLQLLQYLIAKNFVTYSPAHLQIRLNSYAVLFYQRVYKLKNFAEKHTHAHFSQLLNGFISNQLLPVPFSSKHLNALLNPSQRMVPEGKGKKKKQDEVSPHKDELDYSRLIYQYSQKTQKEEKKQQSIQCMVNLFELTQLLRFCKLQKVIKSRQQQYLKSITYKEGQQHLISLSYQQMYRNVRQNRPKAHLIQQIITRVKEQRIEDFILQTFRRYDAETQGDLNTSTSRNILLVFNIIKRNPLCSEKQLLDYSFLPVLVLRKCINLLITQGLVNYYPENIRSTLYKITNFPEIEAKFLNHLCQAVLNIHLASSRKQLNTEQLLKLECMLNDLDDTLLIFGF